MEYNQNTYNNTKKVRDMESSFISVFVYHNGAQYCKLAFFYNFCCKKGKMLHVLHLDRTWGSYVFKTSS